MRGGYCLRVVSRLLENEGRLAWIFGSSRSASTWLLKMLAELEGVVAIDDPHLGHHLGVRRPIPLAWTACEDPPPLRTLLDLKAEEPGYFFAERGLVGNTRRRLPGSSRGTHPLIRWLSEVWVFRSRSVRKAFETRLPENRIQIP